MGIKSALTTPDAHKRGWPSFGTSIRAGVVESAVIAAAAASLIVSARTNLAGGVVAGLAVWIGFTLSRKQLQASRRNEWRLQSVLDNLPAAVYFCDADGLVTYFNCRAVELWGRAPKLNHPNDRYCGSFRLFSVTGEPIAHDQCWMAIAMREQRDMYGREIALERPDGSRGVALAHATPLRDPNGRMVGAVNVMLDITEQSEARERLRQQQEEIWRLDRVRTMGEMAVGLAHELNQPLGAIMNYAAGTLNMSHDAAAPIAAVTPALRSIAVEAKRAGEIIRWLRLSTNKQHIPRLATEPGSLVQAALEHASFELRQNGIEVQTDVSSEAQNVICSGVQIVQVLINLIRNAVDAMKSPTAGGKHLTIRAAQQRGWLRVDVSDMGCGMTDEQIKRMGEAFLTTKEDGMGMGLRISRSIIADNGGELTGRRNAHGGMTMTFTLPLEAAAQAA